MTLHLPKSVRTVYRRSVELMGIGVFLAILQEVYPQFELYGMGTSWLTENCVTKAKGAKGDVLIYWED